MTILGFVGFRWVIFGSDGYSLVTVLLLAKDPSPPRLLPALHTDAKKLSYTSTIDNP